ncbi:MAG: peptidylprolyl isomerase [Phycisphaerales bacterium]|nr:peptidylprolyl isomerase [Phycisphaerales bacterium]
MHVLTRMNRRLAMAGAVATALSLGSAAVGQLNPDRLYYGIKRPAPMTVAVPAGAAGTVEVHLLEPGTAKVLEKATVAAGSIDLASAFPSLWTNPSPRLVYAQLVVGEVKVGPAVVLQPLLTPVYAPALDRGQNPAFNPAQSRVYSGLRAYVDKQVVLDTSMGEIKLALRPEVAPNSAYNFRHLVENGFYTDVIFHRIVATNPMGHGFVIQVGDPTGMGSGGPGYYIDLEPSTLPHDFGVLSMARSGDPNTNGSQVFICLSREGTRMLDGKYTTFGQAVSGADVIQALWVVPVGAQDRPIEPPSIKAARLEEAPPYGEGPAAVTAPGAAPPER